MKIETIKENDLPEVTRIWNDCFPKAFFSPDALRKQIHEAFLLDEKGICCLRDGSEIKGFSIATSLHIPNSGRKPIPGCIPVIAVDRKYRRKGIGTALLKKAEEYLIDQGIRKIRLGYPTYLRGTILSILGLDIEWTGAIKLFENHGYAPTGALDSMSLNLTTSQLKEKADEKLSSDRKQNIIFEPLRSNGKNSFMALLQREKSFPESWYEQFAFLDQQNLLNHEEILVMKKSGRISGFAGPFHIAECGDTCGIGLGVASELQGKGLGLSLLYAIIRMLQEKNGRRITLFGAVDKIKYYGKVGFVPDSIYLFMEKNI